MWLLCLNEQNAIIDSMRINTALGYPDGKGTNGWDVVTKSCKDEIWFLKKPEKLDLEYKNDFEAENIKDFLPSNDFINLLNEKL